MKAGRELDALVAEKVMGLDPKWFLGSTSYYELASAGPRLKPYSTDIAAAMEVEKSLSERGWYFELVRVLGGWRANFRTWRTNGDSQGGEWYVVSAFGCPPENDPDQSGHGYAPLALCRAALRAVGVL